MEYWNVGIMGKETNNVVTQYSSIPSFQHSVFKDEYG
jgi:hypothetical protein